MSFKSSAVLTLAALAPLAVAVPTSAAVQARDMPRPRFGTVPYGQRLGIDTISACTTPGKIALTFDDGPSSLTQTIVNTLQKNGVKATFFIVGQNGDGGLIRNQYHDLVRWMHQQGHQLASHSWSHPDLSTLSREAVTEELVKNEGLFADVLGFVPTYFRPPYTSCDDQCYSVLNELGYHVVDYNLDTLDWDTNSDSNAIFTAAMSSSNPGSNSFISLSHDIQEFTANGFVQRMIDQARAKGYQFVTVGECLGDPAANWYRDPVTGQAFGSALPPASSAAAPTSQGGSVPTPTSINSPVGSGTGVLPPATSIRPTGLQPIYGNGTVTATYTSYTTYCPPTSLPAGVSSMPPAPTGTTKHSIPGPKPTQPHQGGGGDHSPQATKPTSAPYPSGGSCSTCAGVPLPTGGVKPPVVGTGVPSVPTSKPPPVTAGAGRVSAVFSVAAASFFAAAWMAL